MVPQRKQQQQHPSTNKYVVYAALTGEDSRTIDVLDSENQSGSGHFGPDPGLIADV